MSILDFLKLDDDGKISEIIEGIRMDLLLEGYKLIPDCENIYHKITEVAFNFGYVDEPIDVIVRESCVLLGMKLK